MIPMGGREKGQREMQTKEKRGEKAIVREKA
jgi:hypothetical protein